MPKKCNATLSPTEEPILKSITHKGKNHSASWIIHAQALLHSSYNKPQDKKVTGFWLNGLEFYQSQLTIILVC